MTLIVAERVGLQVRILSDTAVSDREAAHAESIPGVLKTVVLSPRTCIAFAGKIHGAYDVIRRIARESGRDSAIMEVAGALLEHNIETGDATEFILAHDENLLKIGQSKIYEGSKRYWVGEADAASQWHRRRDHVLKCTDEDANEGFAASMVAFLQVLDDSEYPSVRGLHFLVVRAKDGYRYERGIHVTSPRAIAPGETVLAASGGPEGGGLSYSYLVTKQAGLPVVAVYFPPGRIGFLYMPLESDDALRYRADTLRDFVIAVSDSHGIELSGMYVT